MPSFDINTTIAKLSFCRGVIILGEGINVEEA